MYGGFIEGGYGLTINIYNIIFIKPHVEILMVSTEPLYRNGLHSHNLTFHWLKYFCYLKHMPQWKRVFFLFAVKMQLKVKWPSHFLEYMHLMTMMEQQVLELDNAIYHKDKNPLHYFEFILLSRWKDQETTLLQNALLWN